MKYDITAVVVVYNNDFEILKKAVDSYFNTSLKIYLTIVDNNSTTGIAKVLENEYGKNKFVRIILSDVNNGYGHGHNTGLGHSPDSSYHLVMNPDVEIVEGSLEKMFMFMEKNRDISMLGPRVLNPDRTMQFLNKRDPALLDLLFRRFIPKKLHNTGFIKKRLDKYMMMDVGYDNTTEVPFLSGCFMFIRRSSISPLVFFDNRYFMYFEDADLTRFLREKGKVVYYPEAVIIHHWARFAHKQIRFMFIFIQSAYRYFNKWGWKIF